MRGHLFDIDTDRAKATYAALKEGELDGLSIGFRTRKSKMDEETGVRTLTDIELWEVSLVTFPANDPARVTAVKATASCRPNGSSNVAPAGGRIHEDQAKCIIAKGYRQVRREAMPSEEACGELLALVQQRAAIFTGEQRS
jgi:hypothetical protein